MRRIAKVGLVFVAAGAVAFALPLFWFNYPTHVPLKAKFPTAPSEVLSQDFTIRTSEKYDLEVGCRDVAPLNYPLTTLLSSGPSQPRIPCDIAVRISQEGRTLQAEHLHSLRPAGYSGGTSYWHLAHVNLPAAGRYRLEITNGSDLAWLAHTGPAVRMDIGGPFYVSAIYTKLIGLIIGAAVGLPGIVLFLFGLRKQVAPNQVIGANSR